MTGYESKKAMAQDKLAQPEQEPVAWYHNDFGVVELSRIPRAGWKPLYTSPPQPEQEPVTWGVDWGKAGDIPCVSIIKRLPNGGIEVVAVEYAPYTFKEQT